MAPETITSSTGKPYAYWQFVSKFCKTRDNGFGLQIVGAKNHDDLRERLVPFMLRRLKEDVLAELPPLRFDELFVEARMTMFPHSVGGEAEIVRAALEADGVDGLKGIASHVATLRRLTGLAKVAPVVDWAKDFIEGSDRKLVLFAHHREVVSGLVDGCSEFTEVACVTGDTRDRQREVDLFQTDPNTRIFIGQLQAAGTGITLTAASDVVFAECSWVPADNSQAAMRVHRIGQRDACLIRFATLAGSIDEQISRAVARKSADIARVLNVDS